MGPGGGGCRHHYCSPGRLRGRHDHRYPSAQPGVNSLYTSTYCHPRTCFDTPWRSRSVVIWRSGWYLAF